jgi:DNA-binding beta-propeller fold protein YncE
VKASGSIFGVLFLLRVVCCGDTLFVAAIGDNTIRKLNEFGEQTLFATHQYSSGGLAFDNSGNLYWGHFGEGYIERFNPGGHSSVFANLTMPTDIACYGGDVYVAAFYANTITRISPTGTKSVFASGSSGLNGPFDLTFDLVGNLYVANEFGSNVVKIAPSGVSTVVAKVDRLAGIAVDAAGDIFVSAFTLDQIKKITPGGSVTTFASGLDTPYGLAFDSAGFLYEADAGSGSVYRFGPSGDRVRFASSLSLPRDLAFQPIPEPSVAALLVTALGSALVGRGFERRSSRINRGGLRLRSSK